MYVLIKIHSYNTCLAVLSTLPLKRVTYYEPLQHNVHNSIDQTKYP